MSVLLWIALGAETGWLTDLVMSSANRILKGVN